MDRFTKGGLEVEPPVGSRGLWPGQGVKLPICINSRNTICHKVGGHVYRVVTHLLWQQGGH